MLLPNRHEDAGSEYRYGFNGMEMDDEVTNGEGQSYNTLFRQYDPRIGKWLSLDPKMGKYPGQSPYIAFNDNPLFFTDPLGDDPPEDFTKEVGAGGTDLYLPKGAEVTRRAADLNGDGKISSKNGTLLDTKEGDVRAFKIGDKIYGSTYDKTGKFTGYKTKDGEIYNSPDFEIRVHSQDGLENDILPIQEVSINGEIKSSPIVSTATYTTGLLEVSKVRMIQVVWTSGTEGAFVDAADKNDDSPYYDNKVYDDFVKNGFTVSRGYRFTISDTPYKVTENDVVVFSTILVIENYNGTGKNVVIGSFEWGYSDYGNQKHGAAANEIKFKSGINEKALKVLKINYPNYELLGY